MSGNALLRTASPDASCVQPIKVGRLSRFAIQVRQPGAAWETSEFGALPISDRLSAKSLSLPLSDSMSHDQIDHVCRALLSASG
jgi:dTDP-4-amino-4,6-dideoxygalactose transaminase